ncbi:LRR/ubiquitin-like domain protein [Rhynchospora pubera]|uniref:LRR/ubiquitin-like domain protein n=1 Tax=Rhynchospora pubera TaxID=906938 RepID=A0AAV8EY72_9POAL|nr:LRR/ubiquitin-like domain protein [Rhynchospora pubera]
MEKNSESGPAADPASGSDNSTGTNTITVQVKFSGRTIPVSVPTEAAARDLKSLLQPLTNVLPRGQKLIFKGKVLEDGATLKSYQIINGSKIMLVASQGLHQGEGPITKPTSSSQSNTRRIVSNSRDSQHPKTETRIEKSRAERWKITGVVALSESQLKEVPEEVWGCGSSIRVLDLGTNFIQQIPSKISDLKSLNKLLLNGNDLSEDSICWEGLLSLKLLSILSLNNNRLTTLPSALCSLTSLSQLHLACNKLISLPVEIGSLTQLEVLKANNNRMSSLPLSIGNCKSLIEIDLSSNLLTELPETLGSLCNLKALYLKNNGVRTVPTTLFKGCQQLSILDLHGTEITNDVLRQIEGWEEFDERRRSKHQKQLDFRVGSSGVFDEGADDKTRGH